jgi:hypothetical protein
MSEPKPMEGYMWVKKDALLQPSDVTINNTAAIIRASFMGKAWQPCPKDFTWQRPRRQHPDIPYIKSRTLHATDGLPQIEQQKTIFEVYELTQQYADALTAIKNRLDAMRGQQS